MRHIILLSAIVLSAACHDSPNFDLCSQSLEAWNAQIWSEHPDLRFDVDEDGDVDAADFELARSGCRS